MKTANTPPFGGAYEPPSPSAETRPGRDQLHPAGEPPCANAIIKLNAAALLAWNQLRLVAHRPDGRPRAIHPLEHARRALVRPQQVFSNKLICIQRKAFLHAPPARLHSPLSLSHSQIGLSPEIIFPFYIYYTFLSLLDSRWRRARTSMRANICCQIYQSARCVQCTATGRIRRVCRALSDSATSSYARPRLTTAPALAADPLVRGRVVIDQNTSHAVMAHRTEPGDTIRANNHDLKHRSRMVRS